MHKDPAQYLRSLSGARIHRGESLELLALDRALIAGLAGRLERRMAFAVSVADRELFVSIADATLTGAVRRCTVESSTDARDARDRRPAHLLERVHDVRVVRPPAQLPRQAVVRRGDHQLAHRPGRVPAAGDGPSPQTTSDDHTV